MLDRLELVLEKFFDFLFDLVYEIRILINNLMI